MNVSTFGGWSEFWAVCVEFQCPSPPCWRNMSHQLPASSSSMNPPTSATTTTSTPHSQFLSNHFSTSDYLHHILQSFTLQQKNTATLDSNSSSNAIDAPDEASSLRAPNASSTTPSLEVTLSLTSSSLEKLSNALKYINQQIHLQLHDNWDGILHRMKEIDALRQCHQQLKQEFQNVSELMLKEEKTPQSLHHSPHTPPDSHLPSQHNFHLLKNQILQAERLYSVLLILRQIARMDDWISEIHSNNLVEKDRVRCARLVTNVLNMYDTRTELHGIDVVHQKVNNTRKLSNNLRRNASQQLHEALKHQQHVNISEALQIFYEMGVLRTEVTSVVTQAIHETKTLLSNTLDPAKQSGAGASSSYSHRRTNSTGTTHSYSSSGSKMDLHSPEAKTEYLFNLKKMFAQVHSIYMQIWHLNRMLKKKKCPDTQESFESIVIREDQISVWENYWISMTRIVTEEMLSAMRNISFVRSIFTDEYPQLLEIFTDFAQKFTSYTGFLTGKGSSASDAAMTPTEWITTTMQDIQQEYIFKCVNRMNDKIDAIFSRVRPPKTLSDDTFSYMSMVDVRALANVIIRELNDAKKSSNLLHLLSKRVSNVLKQFVVQSESIIINQEVAYTVNIYNLPNTFQKFNAQIYNGLCTMHTLISEVIPDFNPHNTVQQDLEKNLDDADSLAHQIVAPVFDSLRTKMEEILFALHLESYSGEEDAQQDATSSYVRQLEQSLSFLCKEHLRLYQKDSHIVRSFLKQTAEQLIRYFVRQISLLNPLQEPARIKLANDMAQVELTTGVNLFHVEKLGTVHRQLKAFRKLLFMDTGDIIASKNELMQEMDHLLIAQHLFSRVPTGGEGLVLRPYNYMDITLSAYNRFIEENEASNNREAIYKVLRNFSSEEISRLQKEHGDQDAEWLKEAIRALETIREVSQE